MNNRKIIVREYNPPRAIKQVNITKGKKSFEKGSEGQERRYFSWAKVLNRYSEDMTADIKLESGLELHHVAVRSSEWAGSGSIGYGERDLPPKDSLVLVIFPNGIEDDALILCSAFSLFGSHVTKWKSELMVSGKETEKLKIDEAECKETTNKSNGDKTIELKAGGKYTLKVSGSGSYKIDANGATIEVTAAGGITITPATGQSVTLAGGVLGCNDYTNCLFAGAPHCNDPLGQV